MKRQSLLLAGATAVLATLPFWAPAVSTGTNAADLSPGPPELRVDYPLNRSCVVTVDPRAASKPEIAGQANKVSGFVAPDTAEGILIHLDSDWLVLRDGSEENWIPKSKILMIRVHR